MPYKLKRANQVTMKKSSEMATSSVNVHPSKVLRRIFAAIPWSGAPAGIQDEQNARGALPNWATSSLHKAYRGPSDSED